jgi:hypothetical protein
MNNKKAIILLLCLCCFHIICNYIWIKKDYFSFSPEKFWTLYQKHEVLVNFKIKTHGLKGYFDKLKRIFEATFPTYRWKLNLFPAYTAFLNYYFGDNIDNSILSNIPFLVLAIVFIFLLGKELFSTEAGLLAAFIISFYPTFFGMSRGYGVDFPLIGAVLVVFYSLIKISKIPDRKHLVVFILLFSVSILLNPRVIFFLLGPLLYVFYKTVEKRKFGSLFKILMVLILTILITSIWWLPRIQKIIAFLGFLINRFNITSLIYTFRPSFIYRKLDYLVGVVRHISIFFSAFFLISLLPFFIKKNPYRHLLIIFLVIPYFILLSFTSGFNRNFFPLFIGFTLITAAGISNIKKSILKVILILSMIIISLFQFFDLSFGTQFLPGIFYRIGKSKKIKWQDDLWVRPPSINDEAIAAHNFFNFISDYKKNELPNTYVLLVGKPLLADFGIFDYIFFSKTDRFILKNFLFLESQNSDYQDCDFAIIVTEKSEGEINKDYPDIKFLNSGPCFARFSYEEKERMYNFFRKLPVLDCIVGKRKIYYLCINPKKASITD